MMKPMLEICCGSFSDVKTAYENGADRVELNSALYMGGLTPTLANLIYAKEKCNIPSAPCSKRIFASISIMSYSSSE